MHRAGLNQQGSSLIMALVMIPAILVGFLSLSTLIQNTQRIQQQTNLKLSLTMVRQDLIVHLANDAAWAKTRQHITSNTGGDNPSVNLTVKGNFDCLANGTDCYSGGVAAKGEILVVYDASDKKFLDTTIAGGGIDQKGEYCQIFGDPGSSKSCPFRYKLTWEAQCSAINCIGPKIDIRGTVEVSTSANSGVPLNLEIYEVNVTRDY